MLNLTLQWNPKINSNSCPPPKSTYSHSTPSATTTHTTQSSPNSPLLPLLQPLPLVHLSVWGYKGRRRMGVDVKGGEAARVWRGYGGVVRGGEVPLWGTRTIIKDSTAASAWFACLIICHMLHTTAISHIRALPLQQTSLRLDETVGEQAPCRKSEHCEGLFTRSSDTSFTVLHQNKFYCAFNLPHICKIYTTSHQRFLVL